MQYWSSFCLPTLELSAHDLSLIHMIKSCDLSLSIKRLPNVCRYYFCQTAYIRCLYAYHNMRDDSIVAYGSFDFFFFCRFLETAVN